MTLYYRGYIIHQDIRSICYTVYGRRPQRTELMACDTPLKAMHWVDRHVASPEPVAHPVRPG
ncbi:MAG: hypothetical protein IH962_01550 [Chloroflexi bacterium]|nr:hypothetical protein [Chloroflexota bacterium]